MQRAAVQLLAALAVVSCAPAPRPDTIVAPVPVTPVLYSPPYSYSYSTFVSHPSPDLALYTPYEYPYSNVQDNRSLFQLACYVLPYYESPFLSFLCLVATLQGLQGGRTEGQLGYGYPSFVL